MSLGEALVEFAANLKRWNTDIFGDINRRKERLRRRLNDIQISLSHQANPGLLKLESKLKGWWEDVLLQEEVMWQQKSREQWLCCGDRNTKFLHLSTLIRRRNTHIAALQAEDGSWVEDQMLLKVWLSSTSHSFTRPTC